MMIGVMKKENLSLMRLLVCAWIFSGIIGCVARPIAQTGRSGSEDLNSQANETPIPLETTNENHGQRCEAKYYFGEQQFATEGGYSSFCYKLQSKLIKGTREGNLVDIRE